MNSIVAVGGLKKLSNERRQQKKKTLPARGLRLPDAIRAEPFHGLIHTRAYRIDLDCGLCIIPWIITVFRILANARSPPPPPNVRGLFRLSKPPLPVELTLNRIQCYVAGWDLLLHVEALPRLLPYHLEYLPQVRTALMRCFPDQSLRWHR